MNRVYIDCGSGVAGDMLLGALIDLGLPLKDLERAVQSAARLTRWSLSSEGVERQGWPARSLIVQGDRYFGTPTQMVAAVRRSPLPAAVKSNAIGIFEDLAWA